MVKRGIFIGLPVFYLASVLVAGLGQAHFGVPIETQTSVGLLQGFFLGFMHPFSTEGQLLGVISFALMLGLSYPRRFYLSLVVLALAMVVGIGLGQAGVYIVGGDPVLLLGATFAACLAALRPQGFWFAGVILLGFAGVLFGLASTPEDEPLMATVLLLLGSFISVNVCIGLGARVIGLVRQRFASPNLMIGLRILTAWVAAVAILMVALVFSFA